MNITQVKIRLLRDGDPIKNWDPRVCAVAGVQLDKKLYLNDIKICKKANQLFIEFARNPYSKNASHPEYTVVPASMQARRWIEKSILDEYLKKIHTNCSTV